MFGGMMYRGVYAVQSAYLYELSGCAPNPEKNRIRVVLTNCHTPPEYHGIKAREFDTQADTLYFRTDAQFKEWVQTVFIPGTSDAEIERLMQLYPSNVTQGSPFDTRLENAFTPQFKRISAFQGDAVFQGPRRWMIENKVTTDVWIYGMSIPLFDFEGFTHFCFNTVSKRSKISPLVGSFHGSELLDVFGVGELGEALVRFATNLNPESQSLTWPKYDTSSRNVLILNDFVPRVGISQDDYRQEAMKYLTQVTLAHPI